MKFQVKNPLKFLNYFYCENLRTTSQIFALLPEYILKYYLFFSDILALVDSLKKVIGHNMKIILLILNIILEINLLLR